MKKKLLYTFLFLFHILVIWSCGTKNIEVSGKIALEELDLYPEGIAYDSFNDILFVSSLTKGSIFYLDKTKTRKQSPQVWVEDDELISVIGLSIDLKENLLIAAVSDVGVSVKSSENTIKKIARIVTFDLTTKEKKFVYNLHQLVQSTAYFANDIALDHKGNAYITDSFSGSIYQINLKNGEQKLLYNNPNLVVPGFGFNGIIYYKDQLLISHMMRKKLIFLDIDDASITELSTDGNGHYFDGLIQVGYRIFGLENNLSGSEEKVENKLVEIQINDGTLSVTYSPIMIELPPQPTTMSLYKDSQIVILGSDLSKLFSGESQKEFDIYMVKIK